MMCFAYGKQIARIFGDLLYVQAIYTLQYGGAYVYPWI
jgi:hypothetical protein